MVNPPRRVKRLRELALKDSSSSTSVPAVNPPLPTSSSPRAPTPPPSTATQRRRGRKPAGPLSKSAREQLRKTNHSVIEKRRREKINEALAALRELVPHDKQDGDGKEDKEFKLEVLVRTVEYLRIMVAKVENLEGSLCQKCGGPVHKAPTSSNESTEVHRAVKRKRLEYSEEARRKLDKESPDPDATVLTSSQSSRTSQPPPRLPSISSWMIDPPVGGPLVNSHPYQLPSPPQSVPFAPTAIPSTGFPPRLVLPSPIGPNSPPSTRYIIPSYHGSPVPEHTPPSRDRDIPELPLDTSLRSPSTSPPPSSSSFYTNHAHALLATIAPRDACSTDERQISSPISPWSRDDQTAASLLLNISSRHSGSGSDEGKEMKLQEERDLEEGSARTVGWNVTHHRSVAYEAQTPSSMLGMAEGSGGSEASMI